MQGFIVLVNRGALSSSKPLIAMDFYEWTDTGRQIGVCDRNKVHLCGRT